LKLKSPYKFFSRHDPDIKYQADEISALEFVHELVNRFIGFEIISHDASSILIKDMGEPSSKEFDTSLRRVLLLAQQMSEETFEALSNSDSKILKHIHDVDINLDKFHDYCIRILNKIGHKESRKTCLLFSTLFYLESMGDEFKAISHHLLYDFDNGNFDHVIDISESIKEQLELYFKLFYKFDREKIIRISEIDSSRYFGVKDKFKETETNEEREIFHHLRIIARYINTLTELRIEMEY
jgi:phosphate uptake regulator